tara:strand:+ start:523 stop:708 length:186 start_codon:yes stop_codon:yes gene_type:complete
VVKNQYLQRKFSPLATRNYRAPWLSKAASKYQIKFSSFSEKQAEAIAVTYTHTRKFNTRLK